jgi:glycosyltransferase involved in cell wall biosynthesis
MKSGVQSISCFFPAFNDGASVGKVVADALALLPELTADYEVIIVDDGSTDDTGEALNRLAATNEHVRVVRHDSNRGYGAALRSGFRAATKDLIFYTDGDGQYDVSELSRLHASLTDGVDVVNGYKAMRSDALHRRMLGSFYNRLAHLLFDLPVRDVDCDFRLMRRQAVQRLKLTVSSGAICVELVHQLARSGAVFNEVPVSHLPRANGRSQFFTPRRVTRTALDLLTVWIRLVLMPCLARPRRERLRSPAPCAEEK